MSARWIVEIHNHDEAEPKLYGPMEREVAERRAEQAEEAVRRHDPDHTTEWFVTCYPLDRWHGNVVAELAATVKDDAEHYAEQWQDRRVGAGLDDE